MTLDCLSPTTLKRCVALSYGIETTVPGTFLSFSLLFDLIVGLVLQMGLLSSIFIVMLDSTSYMLKTYKVIE